MDYDVIIGGGSFAGLAVAAQLRGWRTLLIEPHPMGTFQTSACGTLLGVLEATRTTESLLQVHNTLVLHLGDRKFEYPLPYSFCTFDYHRFCSLLSAQGDAEFLHASVIGHTGHQVRTTRGAFTSRILIDATGWRAALATGLRGQDMPPKGRSFGLETIIPTTENGLHFYFDPHRLKPHSIGWLFPIGNSSIAGFGSYQGHTHLNPVLSDFVSGYFGKSPDGRHGGYFPYRQQPATTGHVFRVGDAAGQCIPLTGEGIRPALYFGTEAGRLAKRVLEGQLSEEQAQRLYREFARQHSAVFRYLLFGQRVLPRLPVNWIERIARRIQQPEWLNPLLRWYWRVFNPQALAMD